MAGQEREDTSDPTRRIVLNMGPQHPATHGVLRLALELDGENIVKCVPHLGYLHTGIEKLSEVHNWTQNITHYPRMDYLSPMNNELAYCLAVEKLLGVEVPLRAQYVRVLMSELTRVISHLVWLGTHAMDVGAMTVFLYTFAEREKILEMYELIGGQRMMTSYMRIGGVKDDMPEDFPKAVRAWANDFAKQLGIYHGLLTKNPIWRQRTMGIGAMDRETSLSYGLSGPLARAAGVDWDLRRDNPYSSYEEFEFDIPVEQDGDVYSRYLVRMEEMVQAQRIALQALDKIAQTEPGTHMREDYKMAPVPRNGINASIEELIHHFKYWTDGVWVPAGEAYGFIEASKGELGFFVVSDGGARPQRVKIRGPSFVNLSALPEMVQGHLIADVIAVIGSIDVVLGEVDR
ncbi:MAG: NADH dehydrogenase [Candidatus Riflebacteria bacterium RBG_13_59_9]|nr:MAG: NADH dehydrogenase [Candidatus Riflebacteria bacterium RBG_13_59_9]